MKKSAALGIFFIICALSIPLDLRSKETDRDRKIQAITKDLIPDLIAIRRDIHAHPELSFQEKRTSALVSNYLEKLGFEVRAGIAKTGVLGILRGKKPGPVVGMRADMDALPITEETGLPFASKEKAIRDGNEVGVMHACGHDIHTTVLLGVAAVFSRFKQELPGTVIFIAQPAEEFGDGANEMLKAGVFKDIKPEAMLAFHVDDTIKAGTIAYTPGFAAANCDGFRLAIKSEGCHGADPYLCVDPIVVGAQIIIALQVMASREVNVQEDPTVITVGSFHAGSASNIISKQADMMATIRTYGEEHRKRIKQKVERLIAHICEAAGAAFDLEYHFGTPALYNNPELLKEILPTVDRILGGKKFLKESPRGMGGEDFSFFARETPSVMLGLGIVPKNLERVSLHSPTFLADEDSIAVGIKVMSSAVFDYLSLHKTKR